MNSDRQARATEILRESATRPPAERHDFAVAACGDDGELRGLVETMLTGVNDSDSTRLIETEVLVPSPDLSSPSDKGSTGSLGGLGTSTVRKRLESGDITGAHIGPYQLLRRIGKGGMGTVYAARRVDQEFRKLVAIKFVKPGMESEEIIQRFRQERQVLAGLDHPNIARLLDGGSDRSIPYLVMEYVEGTPIDNYVRTHRLTVVERLNLFCTVCSAIQYAHQSLVVHRDIKPTNIMVTADGTPKLLDFGIAKVLSRDFGEMRALTMVDERPMTPDFASPEQVGGEPVTTASDVYALGVLLFELLTGGGHPLHYAYKKLGYERAVKEAEPERPSVVAARLKGDAPDIPEGSPEKLRNRLQGDLDAIVLMALRKEPQRRYASVQHFADDVHRYLQGAPVRAQKDTVGYRTRKFVTRHKAGVLAGAVAALALVASSIISYSYYRVAAEERRRAEARFSDVRQLAKFVLFDFDKIIAQGTTPARQAVVQKATEYLSRLEKDRSNDPSLEDELVQGYLKIGDLQGNLAGANLGNQTAAKAYYNRALKVLDSSRAIDARAVAETRTRLADVLAQNGALKDAIAAYEKSRDALRAYSDDPRAKRALLTTLDKLAFWQKQAGDEDAALQNYDDASRLAKDLDAANAGTTEYRSAMAGAELRAGEIRAGRNEVHGLPQMEEALRVFDRLAAAAPYSLAAQRDVAMATGVIGDALDGANLFKQAMLYYRRALEVSEKIAAEDPRNAQYQHDVITYLSRLAEVSASAGDMAQAREHTRRALELLRPLASGADASKMDLWQYTWTLLTTAVTDLRNPAAAKQYAERLVEMSKEQDPAMLDLLARAYAGMRDYPRAVETEERAVALLPADKESEVRSELEANLAAFRAHKPAPEKRQ